MFFLFQFILCISTLIPRIPILYFHADSHHSHPDSLHSRSYSRHSYPDSQRSHPDSLHSHHSPPDSPHSHSDSTPIGGGISALIPRIPIILFILFPDSHFRVLQVLLTDTFKRLLTHHKIIDHIAQQIVLVCKKSKLWIHPNLWWPNLSFIYSSKFTYLCTVDMWTLKRNFVIENKKPFTAIITATNKRVSQRYIATQPSFQHNKEAFRNLHMQVEISSCFGYVSNVSRLRCIS